MNRANIAFNLKVPGMCKNLHRRNQQQGRRRIYGAIVCVILLCAFGSFSVAHAQDDPLNKVHVTPPPSPTPANGPPPGAQSAPATGAAAAKARPGAFIRMNVDMVLVPVTVTD